MIDLPSMLDAKETGPGRWIARCPSHGDKRPSLSIRRADDRWLLHDFGGCHTVDVVRALGIEFTDLFDDQRIRRIDDTIRRPRIPASERLLLIEHEINVVVVILADIIAKKIDAKDQWHRLVQASARIGRARHA